MADHDRTEPLDPIEAELRDLGRHLAVPAVPDVTAAVRARLEAEQVERPARRTGTRLAWRPAWRAAAIWAAAVAVVFAGSVAVSPQVRAAVVDLLRFAGIEIHQDEAPPGGQPGSRYVPLPGERTVDLSDAARGVGFRVFVPGELGEPDLVTVADGDPPRVVSLLYFAGPGRPPAVSGTDRPAVRIDQFEGTIAPVFSKYIDAGRAVPVQVGSNAGFWIDRPHQVLYVDRDRMVREESSRLSGQTLIVEMGGTTIRIEGSFTKERALEIALSLTTVED